MGSYGSARYSTECVRCAFQLAQVTGFHGILGLEVPRVVGSGLEFPKQVSRCAGAEAAAQAQGFVMSQNSRFGVGKVYG